MRIRKAVLPVAGLGTRVLPASKVIPKEMLPIVDKPTLQYIVEEAVAAGVEEIIFVNSRSKRSIEDHFDQFPELEVTLERKGKRKELEELRALQTMATYVTVRQPQPLGLGHAVLCAIPDLIEVYERYGGSVLSLVPLPPEVIPTYGIAAVQELGDDALKVIHLVEKPTLEEAPSDLGVYGRYILTPDIFALLEQTPPGKGGEIQVTDAIEMQAKAGNCYGLRFTGERYDTGTPLGLLTTSIAFALKRPDMAADLHEYMRQALNQE